MCILLVIEANLLFCFGLYELSELVFERRNFILEACKEEEKDENNQKQGNLTID